MLDFVTESDLWPMFSLSNGTMSGVLFLSMLDVWSLGSSLPATSNSIVEEMSFFLLLSEL